MDLDKQAAVHAFEALGFEAHAYINDYVQYVKSTSWLGLASGRRNSLARIQVSISAIPWTREETSIYSPLLPVKA